MKVELDLSNYATIAGFIKVIVVDTSKFAKRTYLASLKSNVGELDINNLQTVPVGLSKLGNVVDNDIISKTEYNKLVTKVNAIDTSGFETQYNTDKSGPEK